MDGIHMSHININSLEHIHNDRYTIHRNREFPASFDTNKWIYHVMPDFKQLQADIRDQREMHISYGAHHVCMMFPENIAPSQALQAKLHQLGFEVGVLELYAIEASELSLFEKLPQVSVAIVDRENLDAYLEIFDTFSAPYGQSFMEEARQNLIDGFDTQPETCLLAYYEGNPVGIMNVIISDEVVEIDGFGVIEAYRNRGIGRTMQQFVGELAQERPIILVADGEDTAKDMYIQQGYVYQGFQYQIVKEYD
ncbi:GNAT family N-acetyltransferase [Staphylococcus massiliensis]|uniref:GNAT family N-acetyltransferase n=1 Tax=Staphylococcus massiliensis TaxID=555791 RepID=UPI0002E57E95|nr:GNAT family N-acetyltransferase [Staphylococcus massiliensis]MCG3399400.1 GNAT family N-acetyltransferase [Staphylococcus massiliensis]MCG3402499.1 GNAT family N-acetyltransferase [Staphylococcus massiliensis]MCG3411536.1 GNAT family N-acetyltransferase [Staphylococcus massiliensis]PNZ98758.1 N-acetyltransferase [Staphylococcus massiliensis CCUG 55927]